MTAPTIHTPHPGSREDAVAQDSKNKEQPAAAALMETEQPFYVRVQERAAVFGGYSSLVLVGTETTAWRVMPRDDQRARGYITCSGAGPVLVGHDKEALLAARANGLPSSGQILGVFVLQSGVTLPVTHQEPVFVMADGSHAANVGVAVERWSSERTS